MIAKNKQEEVLDVLASFKSIQSADSTVLDWFNLDPYLQVLLLAWPKVACEIKGGTGAPPSKEHEQWAWLWKNYVYDAEEWLRLAGITNLKYGLRLIERVIRLRLIFPDGTHPSWLARFIRMRSLAATQRLVPKQQKKEEPKKKGKDGDLEDDEEEEDAEE